MNGAPPNLRAQHAEALDQLGRALAEVLVSAAERRALGPPTAPRSEAEPVEPGAPSPLASTSDQVEGGAQDSVTKEEAAPARAAQSNPPMFANKERLHE